MVKLPSQEIIDKFQEYYEREPMWGNLHLSMEDGNLEDENIWYDIHCAEQENDDLAIFLGNYLLGLTEGEREYLYNFPWK